jgi:hypothetical protein
MGSHQVLNMFPKLSMCSQKVLPIALHIFTSVNLVHNALIELPRPVLLIVHSDFLNCG